MVKIVGVLNFDAGATFEEYSKITQALLDMKFELELKKLSGNILPRWSGQQILITREVNDG